MTGVAVVVPVKRLTRAKSRLDATPLERQRIMLDLLVETITTATRARGVECVVITTVEPLVAAAAGLCGAISVDDGGADINASLGVGKSWLRSETQCTDVILMVGDLAAPQSEDISALLAEYRRAAHPLIVDDWTGTGTTCLVHSLSNDPGHAFGQGSAERHTALGYRRARAELTSLRYDLDTRADLFLMRGRGQAPAMATAPRGG